MVFLYSFYVLYLIIENVSLAIQCFILIATVFNIISQTILRLCLPAASLYNNKIELFFRLAQVISLLFHVVVGTRVGLCFE